VLNAPGAPRSPENTENASLSLSLLPTVLLLSLSFPLFLVRPDIQTGFGRGEMPPLLPSSSSGSPRYPPRSDPRPLILFLTRPSEADGPLVQAEPLARLILHVLYLGEKSMSSDMLTRVQTWRARELARKDARGGMRAGEPWKSGYWYAVSDFAVSQEGKGVPRAERDALPPTVRVHVCKWTRYAYARVHARTRARHARGWLAGRPVNQNYS